MWHLICYCLFLISPSFDSSGILSFMIVTSTVTSTRYLYLYIFVICVCLVCHSVKMRMRLVVIHLFGSLILLVATDSCMQYL